MTAEEQALLMEYLVEIGQVDPEGDCGGAVSSGYLPSMFCALEVWPETQFSPSRRFLNVDCRCNSGFLKRIAYTTMPYKTGLGLLGVARNPANGFPARLLVLQQT